MNNQELQELFAVPIHSKLVATFDKTPLYSSNYLIKKYKQALANSKYTSPSYGLLENLINNHVVMPVYLSSNIFSYSFHKIFGHSSQIAGALAFFDPDSNRIFVLVDMNTTFGFVSDKWIAKLTIHEMMHMACAQGKDAFKKLFMDEYIKFYTYFFHVLADEAPTPQSMKDMRVLAIEYINVFHRVEVHKSDLEASIFKKGFNILYKVLKYFNVDEKTIGKIQNGYKYILVMYIKYGVSGIVKALQYRECRYLLMSLKNTYPIVSKKSPNTLAIQELLFPSEVIAVLSETGYISSKIPSAIKMIKPKN